MKTYWEIREQYALIEKFVVGKPTKKLTGFFPATTDAIKGKVVKFGVDGSGIGTEQYINDLKPGNQKELISVIKKYNIRSFAWGGKPTGAAWLKAWVKANKNLDHNLPGQVVSGTNDQDISKEILNMFKAFNKTFGGKKAYMNHNNVILYFIEIQ